MISQPLTQLVAELKPGHRIRIDEHFVREFERTNANPGWSGADWVLESIPGSAYEFSYSYEPYHRCYLFSRLPEPLSDGLRTYVSPDRRDRFRQRHDGFWEALPRSIST